MYDVTEQHFMTWPGFWLNLVWNFIAEASFGINVAKSKTSGRPSEEYTA